MTDNDGGREPALAHGRIISPGTEHQLGTYGLFPPSALQQRILRPGSAALTARNAEPELLWISFAELCGGGASLADYRALAGGHSTWVVDGVPSPGEAGSPEAAQAWIRFSAAVQAVFERGGTLFLVGRHPLDFDGAAAALRDAHGPDGTELSQAMERTARRLAVLARVESLAEHEPEEISGS
ncbi:MAG: uncharacterized protein JWQ75_1680 [Pseudarthrobacter sp.]|nr:uncharacterized protein [Pseudarthrobacter sp.]